MDEKIHDNGIEFSQHKLSDYEYKSFSYGVSVPDGWERCPGDKVDVIRRLKPQPVATEQAPTTKAPEAKCGCNTVKNKDAWESWKKPCGGCC
jgi:hypothetical protein